MILVDGINEEDEAAVGNAGRPSGSGDGPVSLDEIGVTMAEE